MISEYYVEKYATFYADQIRCLIVISVVCERVVSLLHLLFAIHGLHNMP
jgi:hypothetical protein